jgi:hypothetical protein
MIGRQRNLREIAKIDHAAAICGAKVPAVAMGGQKPENVGARGWGDRHGSAPRRRRFFFKKKNQKISFTLGLGRSSDSAPSPA